MPQKELFILPIITEFFLVQNKLERMGEIAMTADKKKEKIAKASKQERFIMFDLSFI